MKTDTPRFFTTPIYYVNAKPHLGHAYTTITTDVAARYSRMCGNDTYFLTGTDEHGDKIVQAAEQQKITPKAFADSISGLFQGLWPRLNISNDHFIRTTNPDHIKVVQSLLTKIHDSGDIYFSEYEGIYCFGCERFYQERELVDGKCPDHGTEPSKIKESNYFFAMSKYQEWLIDHIKSNPDFIRPERYRNEVLSFLKEPLEDLCISRPKSRLTWGITLPFDDNYVTYVWFDALTNYISALGYPDGDLYSQFWPHTRHFVAKDIIKPHGIYWPTMLKAAGIDLYQSLNVHGFWNVSGSKMSKSIGNVTDPVEVTETYGVDPFRYFLMREMVFGLDANFTEDAIVQRINSDLANDLGNLFSRVLSMLHRYFKGVIPETDPTLEAQKELSLRAPADHAIEAYTKAMDNTECHKALTAVWEFISILNKYIDTTAPWTLAKDDAAAGELAIVITNMVEGLRLIACLIHPVMPGTARTMLGILGLEKLDTNDFYTMEELTQWPFMKPGMTTRKPPMLFPRVEVDKVENPDTGIDTGKNKTQKGLKNLKPEITFEEFSRLDLRTGTIVSAEKIEKSNKLLKLQVDLGQETRQIIAGIAKSYEPDVLIGKQVVVVANLKPAKLMGELSQGMIVAANGKKQLFLAVFDESVMSGLPVK